MKLLDLSIVLSKLQPRGCGEALLAPGPGRKQRHYQNLGFVSGEQKHSLLREADLFCFPTYYEEYFGTASGRPGGGV